MCIRDRIHTLGGIHVVRLFETGPTRIDRYKALQYAGVNHPEFGKDGLVAVLCVIQHPLDGIEVITRDNRGMMIEVPTLRLFPVVLQGAMRPIVFGIGLSSQDIPAMTFIPKD